VAAGASAPGWATRFGFVWWIIGVQAAVIVGLVWGLLTLIDHLKHLTVAIDRTTRAIGRPPSAYDR
jgi:hypothetical protein